MKEQFEYAQVEIVEFMADDVIVTSDEYEGENPGSGYIRPSLF